MQRGPDLMARLHPVVIGAGLLAIAALWCGSFKLLAALCRATMGAGQ